MVSEKNIFKGNWAEDGQTFRTQFLLKKNQRPFYPSLVKIWPSSVWRDVKSMKVERQITEDGGQGMAIVHMILWVRWAKMDNHGQDCMWFGFISANAISDYYH
jgi:hypothetical protein